MLKSKPDIVCQDERIGSIEFVEAEKKKNKLIYVIYKLMTTIELLIYIALDIKENSNKTLTEKEVETLTVIADTIFPPGGPIPLSGSQADVPTYLDNYLQHIPADKRKLIRLLFILTEWMPVIFGPKRTFFLSLTNEERLECLKVWEPAPKKQEFKIDEISHSLLNEATLLSSVKMNAATLPSQKQSSLPNALQEISNQVQYFHSISLAALRTLITLAYMAHPEVIEKITAQSTLRDKKSKL